MLILVGASVTVALNGGLLETAQDAVDRTKAERDNELAMSTNDIINQYLPGEEKPTIVPKKETYTVGEPVTIGEESFYVIADDSQKVTLLAKDCIDTATLVQSSSANTVAFSTEQYWEDWEDPIVEPEPTLDAQTGKLTLPASHIAAKAAYDYGAKVGGTGRLMTYSEATTLRTANSDILYGTNGKSSSEDLSYWLGSASDGGCVCVCVYGNIGGMGSDIYNYGVIFGVRPVVEISKSAI